MPELPEVEAVRLRLERAMRGKSIARVLLRRADLRRPFPEGFASRLESQTIRSLRRRGKYLLLDLSSGDVLLIHLGMSGSFRIGEDGSPDAHDHVVFELSNGSVVIFNDPRRFGLMDIMQAGSKVNIARSGRWASSRSTRRSTRSHWRARVPTARRRSKSRSSINGWSQEWGISTRARRCTAPACRRGAWRRRSPPHSDVRARLRSD